MDEEDIEYMLTKKSTVKLIKYIGKEKSKYSKSSKSFLASDYKDCYWFIV